MYEETLKDEFLLDQNVTFLNHGSFGACPRPVFDQYQQWQLELERQPVEFLGRRSKERLEHSRTVLADYLGTEPDSVVYVSNATWGVNVAIRSLDLQQGDEVLTTNHEYGANNLAWNWLLRKAGASLVTQPIDVPVSTQDNVVDQLFAGVTNKTRAIFLSHITSPTALIMPISEICTRARDLGILTIVDGAHAPGQIDIDLEALGVDVYAGNLHKWLSAPKGAGFLYVSPDHQDWIESLIVSWGWGRDGELQPSSFVERNEWQGTRDIAAFLSVPAAIEFQASHDWESVRSRCHGLASSTRNRISNLTGLSPLSPDSRDWFNQMVACPIATKDTSELKSRLYDEFQVEIPVSCWNGQQLVRASFQGYNDQADADHLLTALEALL